ncbi:MAG: DUF308 domain-containing protein [Odoribacter sp.]
MQIVYTSTNIKGAMYRDILAIILGLVLVVWPETAQKYIIMLIGLIFLTTGLTSFIISQKKQDERPRRFLSFNGIGSMVLGLLLLCAPSWFATVFMIFLGFILIIAAVGQFVSLAASRQFGVVSPVSYIFPVLILIAGIVVIFNPFESNIFVFRLFGFTAIFYGITDLLNQYTIKKMRRVNEDKEKMVKMEDGQEVEDAEYEEVKD